MWDTFQFILTFVPLFFLGGSLAEQGFSVAGWFCVGLSIIVAFAAYEVPRARQRRLFRSSPSATGERVFIINADGIDASFPTSTVHYQWRAFTRYRETDLSFLLLASAYVVTLWIPKRVMSREQIEELRNMLNAHLPAR